jgi:hypothetical protein
VPAAARAGAESGASTRCALGSLEPLVPALTAAATRKVIHAARQDLEAFYLTTKRVISPVFDTQIAAGCIGLKPQIGYAELVKTLLDVTVSQGPDAHRLVEAPAHRRNSSTTRPTTCCT